MSGKKILKSDLQRADTAHILYYHSVYGPELNQRYVFLTHIKTYPTIKLWNLITHLKDKFSILQNFSLERENIVMSVGG